MKRYHVILGALTGTVISIGAAVAEEQTYPNLPPPLTLLDNECVSVQGAPTVTSWTGMHKHAGNQLAVVIDPFKVEYLDSKGERSEVAYEKGSVFWIGDIEHDHRATAIGRVVIVTIKGSCPAKKTQ